MRFDVAFNHSIIWFPVSFTTNPMIPMNFAAPLPVALERPLQAPRRRQPRRRDQRLALEKLAATTADRAARVGEREQHEEQHRWHAAVC